MAVKAFLGVPIYTMDTQFSVHEALVVEGDRVRFLGSTQEALRKFPEAERIEFEEGCILPGFIDAHLHLRDFALLVAGLDLYSENLREGLLEQIRGVASGKSKDEWITGGGAGLSILNDLNRDDLDAVCPDNPLVIYSRGMHSMLVNSAALSACHIDSSQQDPLGGTMERDSSGRLNGMLRGRAVELIGRHIPEQETKSVQAAIERGIDKLVAKGVTTFCDCSVYNADLLMRTLTRLHYQQRLKARGVLMFSDRAAARLGSMGIQSLFGNAKVKIGGCKVILDGSFSSMTAYMSRPYVGVTNTGMLLMEEQELHHILKRSYADYIWAGVHAIGDRAVEIALRVYGKLAKEVGIPKLLKRIEHAQSLKDEDIEKFSETGVIPVVNPVHIPIDRGKALSCLGSNARLQYRLGSLSAAGASLAIGSDAPVGSINPFHGIYAAVERKDFNEGPELRFFPNERIQLRDALLAYTRGSAAALGLEKELGSLEPGKYADLIVLSQDVLSQDDEALATIEVKLTLVGGETVYEGEND
jgi:predicted amidohydrolase YtcJ